LPVAGSSASRTEPSSLSLTKISLPSATIGDARGAERVLRRRERAPPQLLAGEVVGDQPNEPKYATTCSPSLAGVGDAGR
jgi:hypothetical protein